MAIKRSRAAKSATASGSTAKSKPKGHDAKASAASAADGAKGKSPSRAPKAPSKSTKPQADQATAKTKAVTSLASSKSPKAKPAAANGKSAETKKVSRKASNTPRKAATSNGKGTKGHTSVPASHATGKHASPSESHVLVAELIEPLPAELAASIRLEQEAMRKSQRSEDEERILKKLMDALEQHAKAHQLGQVAADPQFDWSAIEDAELHPDLAYVSYERWAPYRFVPRTGTWHVVPDLVVEIVRDAEESAQSQQSLESYFKAGVSRVWLVYPRKHTIHDHDSTSSSRRLESDQPVDGGSLLPGFQVSLRELEEVS